MTMTHPQILIPRPKRGRPDTASFHGFMALPRELRDMIYSYMLPTNLRLHFVHYSWYDWGRPRLETMGLKDKPRSLHYSEPLPKYGYETAICRVNRQVYEETRTMIYGDNTFLFKLHGYKQLGARKELGNPLYSVFGGLQPQIFQRIKRLELLVSFNSENYWCRWRMQRQMDWLITKILDERTIDQSELRSLKIIFDVRQHIPENGFRVTEFCQRHIETVYVDMAQFVLEPLTKLRGVVRAEVAGTQEWFARCLEMYLRGEGGSVSEMVYPDAVVSQRVKARGVWKNKKVTKPGKLWYEPDYDWEEFARRNGVAMIEDLCREEERDATCGFQGRNMI